MRGAPHHHSPSVISSTEMTAIAYDIVETTEDEPCGESEGTPSDGVIVGKVAAIGTCHKCGGSLRRGRKEIARLCKKCGTRFHSIDCGNRLQISGYPPGMSEQCPKVRRVLTSRLLSMGSSLRCLFFFFSRASRASAHPIPRPCSCSEARASSRSAYSSQLPSRATRASTLP